MTGIPPSDMLIPGALRSKIRLRLKTLDLNTRRILVMHEHAMVVLKTLAGAALSFMV